MGKPQKIEVRGHTSLRPAVAQGNVADNWDLSYLRCRNTMEFLVGRMNIDARRVRMSVAGPNEPLALDAAAKPSQQNPRVEVFLLDETVPGLETPEPATGRNEASEANPPANPPR